MSQTQLTDYASETPANPFDDLPREWGPTKTTPIPTDPILPHGPDVRELPGSGLAPSDFEILNGICHPDIAIEKGYHPDDSRRPRNIEAQLDTPGVKTALANQPHVAAIPPSPMFDIHPFEAECREAGVGSVLRP